MRRRQDTNAEKKDRPKGPLTEKELEDIRQAYREGGTGEILIALRGKERIITMLLPAQSAFSSSEIREQLVDRIKRMGCAPCVLVRR